MNPFAEPNSREMAEEVENERAGLVNTLDQLRENLRPENVVDEVFSQAQASSSDFMDKVWNLARANPIPAALIGIGAAMLVSAGQRYKRRAGRSDAAWTRFEDDADDPSIFDAAAGDRQAGFARSTWDLDIASDRDETRSRRLSGLSRLIDEQPLVLAAIGIAAGAAVGAAIPSTDLESEWMGDTSESVRQSANSMAREQLSQMRSTASQTLDQMKATAVQHGVSAENLSGLVHDLGEQAKRGASSLGQTTPTT